MQEIAELVRRPTTPRTLFDALVGVVIRVLDVSAVALALKDGDEVLVWCERDGEEAKAAMGNIARCALARLRAEGSELEHEALQCAAARRIDCRGWISVPLVDAQERPFAALTLATSDVVDEAAKSFLTSIGRCLSVGMAPRISADQDPDDARRAREDAESRAEWLGLLANLTAVLFSSLEYTATLREIARLLSERVASACIVDLVEQGQLHRIVHAPRWSSQLVTRILDPVLSRVLASGRAIVVPPGGVDEAHRSAAAALDELSAAWLVCVPIRSDSETLGALSILGSAEQPRFALDLAFELAARAAHAIENGRRYHDAVHRVHVRDEALAMVSHDLRNPLGSILLNASHMLESAPATDRRKSGRRHLESILRSVNRMTKLVGDLLDFQALDGGAMKLHPCARDLLPLVDEALETIKPSFEDKEIRVECDVSPWLPYAFVDGDRIVQVITNVVANAIKFTPAKGMIRIRAEAKGGEILVSVADTGCGIPEEEIPHVFQRFWHAAPVRGGGSGLGLAICKGIVELSGGRIWIDSRVGAGTTVSFTLPLATREQADEAPTSPGRLTCLAPS